MASTLPCIYKRQRSLILRSSPRLLSHRQRRCKVSIDQGWAMMRSTNEAHLHSEDGQMWEQVPRGAVECTASWNLKIKALRNITCFKWGLGQNGIWQLFSDSKKHAASASFLLLLFSQPWRPGCSQLMYCNPSARSAAKHSSFGVTRHDYFKIDSAPWPVRPIALWHPTQRNL